MSESSRSLPSARTVLRRGRRRARLRAAGGPVLRRRPHRSGAGAAVPAGRLGGRRDAAAGVPGAVLGRADDLLRAARAPAAADAARAVRHRPGRARRVADATCATPSTPSSCPPSRTPRCGVTWRWRPHSMQNRSRRRTPPGRAPARPATPSRPRGARALPTRPCRADWWRDAVFYQVYIRSFADGNGDGVGDLAGIRCRLPYLADLGVDALWITPFYPSPMADHGYDVADPRDVEPVFGDLADFDALLADAHELGIRVTIDLVPNHSSHQHEWFRQALAAGARLAGAGALPLPRRPRPGRRRAAEQLAVGLRRAGLDPGARRAVVPAHLRAGAARPGLHQPRGRRRPRGRRCGSGWTAGVDGFRIDVAHGMAKPDGAAGHGADGGHRAARRPRPRRPALRPGRRARGAPPDPRGARRVPRHDGRRRGLGERRRAAGAVPARPTSCSWPSTSSCSRPSGAPTSCATAIDDSLATVAGTPAPACWVLSNHDVRRHVSRYGDGELGVRRARAAALLQLALPGAAYLYNGDELGLPNVDDLPDEVAAGPDLGAVRPDPSAAATAAACRCRGRATSRRTASPPRPRDLAAHAGGLGGADGRGAGRPTRGRCCRCTERRSRCARRRPRSRARRCSGCRHPTGCLAFRRPGGLVCLVNLSDGPVPLPEGRVLLASADVAGGHAARPTRRRGWRPDRGRRHPVGRRTAVGPYVQTPGDQRRPCAAPRRPGGSWPPPRCPRCRRARWFWPTSSPPSARGTPALSRSVSCSPRCWPRWPCRCPGRRCRSRVRRWRSCSPPPSLGPAARHAVQVLYMPAALVGLPFYSDASGGVDVVFGATGGYVIGFIPAALPDRPGGRARRGPQAREGGAAVHRRPGGRSSPSACRGSPSRPACRRRRRSTPASTRSSSAAS